MRWLAIAMVVAACGDNLVAPPDAASPETCTARFTGNFTETSATPANCPTVRSGGLIASDLSLDIEIAIAAIDTSIGITIDLGAAPTPGVYSSETTSTWSALALARVPTGACIYNAGTNAIPAGSFVLTLDSLDQTALPFGSAAGHGTTGHGTLDVTEYVLRYVDEQGHESDCGVGDTESVDLVF